MQADQVPTTTTWTPEAVWQVHLPLVRMLGLCAAIALAYCVRALHQRLDQLERAVFAREQRVELLCAQLRSALAEAGRADGTGGMGGTESAGTMTLASLGGVDIRLGAAVQPDAHTVSRWVIGAAQWLFRSS